MPPAEAAAGTASATNVVISAIDRVTLWVSAALEIPQPPGWTLCSLAPQMAEERLWAPWRLDYIRGPKDDECIFCRAVESGDDERYHVVHRGERCFVILNTYPYNNGHVMIAP